MSWRARSGQRFWIAARVVGRQFRCATEQGHEFPPASRLDLISGAVVLAAGRFSHLHRLNHPEARSNKWQTRERHADGNHGSAEGCSHPQGRTLLRPRRGPTACCIVVLQWNSNRKSLVEPTFRHVSVKLDGCHDLSSESEPSSACASFQSSTGSSDFSSSSRS